MFKALLAPLLFASAGALALPQCPEPQRMELDYPAPSFAVTGFDHSANRFISLLPSYHMVHDLVLAEGQGATLTAKFDYGTLVHKDLEDEKVRFYLRGPQQGSWQFLGQGTTNSDGKASIALPALAAGQYRIYAGVPGDGSGAQGFVTVIQPGTQAVLFDIDGTLTESDAEQLGDYTGIDRADPKDGAYSLVRRYLDLGYQPVFLTARVYWYAKGSRSWLDWMGLPQGFLRTSLSNEDSLFNPRAYKAAQIRALQAQGLNIVRAYGNAKSDAEAFIDAGIPPSSTFTIGSDAGYNGTTPIAGNSYGQHIAEAVDSFPAAACQ
ncbi:hypothetical protein [Gallaecimonas xiamenensis]|uniref:LNS2/PITP domain-containing protein n=1 Tax=Gallaecimonas xiamenensis 3-C-1 TaxID=745411 RepID=K2JMP9_9GAMM|nr:hypothetical protein [Gallaecimonas xiamenensis]EKE75662.1 hypothetical protein B3C1_06268 [Gallaecimonas xiamenensis 3-C-1]